MNESGLNFYKADLNSASNEFSQGVSPNGAPQSLQLNKNLRLTFQHPTGEKQILCIFCHVKINCKTKFFFPNPQPSRPTLNLQKNQQTVVSLLGKSLQTQTTKQLLEKEFSVLDIFKVIIGSSSICSIRRTCHKVILDPTASHSLNASLLNKLETFKECPGTSWNSKC